MDETMRGNRMGSMLLSAVMIVSLACFSELSASSGEHCYYLFNIRSHHQKYDPVMNFQRRSFEHEAPLEDFLWYPLTNSLPRSR